MLDSLELARSDNGQSLVATFNAYPEGLKVYEFVVCYNYDASARFGERWVLGHYFSGTRKGLASAWKYFKSVA